MFCAAHYLQSCKEQIQSDCVAGGDAQVELGCWGQCLVQGHLDSSQQHQHFSNHQCHFYIFVSTRYRTMTPKSLLSELFSPT